jgi:hypothetical protein|tara:strand:+ start:1315 stop:1575 length:261 start_codon:yes stop_codon:yes gene_type:complete
MNIDIFVEQWKGPESLDYYYIDWIVKEVKRLREENKELEEFLNESHATNKIRYERLIRAQKWAYKQLCHNDSAMMDYDDYVWGEEE